MSLPFAYKVPLHVEHLQLCDERGRLRWHASRTSGRNADRSKKERTPAERRRHEMIGNAGELAVAIRFGIHWSAAINTFKTQPDVGPWDVRAVGKHHLQLLIRNDDPPTRPFVLVTCDMPNVWTADMTPLTMHIRGWMFARDAHKDEWLKDPGNKRPSWFVPQSALNDPRELWSMLRSVRVFA